MGLGSILKKATNVITDPVGNIINSATGASSAAKQSQKYALQSAEVANQYQKEFAQNAHQWEVEDLEKAGINPILYAGGGAPAGAGSVNSAQMSSGGVNPMSIASTISDIIAQQKLNKKTDAETKNTEEETNLTKEKQTTEKLIQQQKNEEILKTNAGWLAEVFGTNIHHIPEKIVNTLTEVLTGQSHEVNKEIREKLMQFRLKHGRSPTEREALDILDPFQPKKKGK